MTLTTIRHWLTTLGRAKHRWRAPLWTSSAVASASALTALDDRSRDAPQNRRAELWRRRTLLRKGAHLYSTVTTGTDFVSLAMLDQLGGVVALYERGAAHGFEHGPTLCSHVSQLYIAEDVAMGIPIRDLCSASIHGSSRQIGWRRRRDGPAFWASTLICPILRRDGSLQGFSHVIRRLPASYADALEPSAWLSQWPAANAPELGAYRFVSFRKSARARGWERSNRHPRWSSIDLRYAPRIGMSRATDDHARRVA